MKKTDQKLSAMRGNFLVITEAVAELAKKIENMGEIDQGSLQDAKIALDSVDREYGEVATSVVSIKDQVHALEGELEGLSFALNNLRDALGALGE